MRKIILFAIVFAAYFLAQAQPKVNTWNGVCYAVIDYIEKNANDPESIKFVECSYISKFSNGNYGQRVKYRGKNAFGALVLNENYFIMSGNGEYSKVEGMFDMETMNLVFSTGKVKIIATYDSEGKVVKE